MASKEIPLIECDGEDCDNVEFGSSTELEDLIRYCTQNGWAISTSQDICPTCREL